MRFRPRIDTNLHEWPKAEIRVYWCAFVGHNRLLRETACGAPFAGRQLNPTFPIMFTQLADRRERLAAGLRLTDEILLIGAGLPVALPENTDQTYPFRAHSEFFYVTALECPGAIVAFDPQEGPRTGWKLFVPEVTEAEQVWEARKQTAGEPLAALPAWIATRRDHPVIQLGAPLPGVRADEALTVRIREAFTHARRPKDELEIATMHRAAAATAAGYARAVAIIAPGVTERAIQIELEAGFFRHGATRTGYGTIVGTGPNSAVLHFEPTGRAAREGEFVLIDAGAEIDRYVIDVTRTYVAGPPSPFQRDLYQVVLAAQEKAITRCRAGAEWRDVHLQCAVDLTAGLVSLGLMRGSAESLVEQEAHLLFFRTALATWSASACAMRAAPSPAGRDQPGPASRACAWMSRSRRASWSPSNPACISFPPYSTIPNGATAFATPWRGTRSSPTSGPAGCGSRTTCS